MMIGGKICEEEPPVREAGGLVFHVAPRAGAGIETRAVGVAVVARPTWPESQKLKALAIADAVTVREAAAQTGVPEGTIKRWRFELRTERGEPSQTNRTPKNLKPVLQEAVDQAVAEASEYITERLKTLANGMYELARQGLEEAKAFMATTPDKDRDSAAWLRAVIGAMHYGIQDAQLISGKPTARPEVMEKREYDITHRVVTEHPGVLEDIFAADQRSGLAHRCRPSPPLGMGLVLRPDLPESEALLPPG